MNEQLQEAESRLEIAKVKVRTAVAVRQAKLLESYGYTGIDPYDAYSPRYGNDQFRYGGFGAVGPNADQYTDRTKVIRTLAQLNLAQNRAEELVEINGNATAVVKALTSYVVGCGSEFHIVSADEDAEPPPVITKKTKKLLTKFHKINKYWELEKDMERRLLVHGEFFLRLFVDEDNVTKVRFIEPQQIKPPTGENDNGPWSWGIQTHPGDTRTPVAYNVHDFETQEDEEVDAAFIVHVKVNCLTNAKRGIPGFFTVDDELRGSAKVRWAGREGEAVRQCIAYFRKHAPEVSKTAVEALADGLATDFPPFGIGAAPTNSQGDQYRVTQLAGPSVVDTSTEVEGPPNGSYVGAEVTVDQALQAVAANFQIPEQLVSGKTDVSTFAAALTSEAPFQKTIEGDQTILSYVTVEVYERVIEIGIMQDEVPENTLDEIELQVTYPDSITRDAKGETDRRKVLVENGVMSVDTWRNEEGLDSDHEKAKIIEEPHNPAPSPALQLGTGVERVTR